MSKHKSVIPAFTTTVNATTASPIFVQTLTDDVALFVKTALVILVEEKGSLSMSVFRESTAVAGSYSRDMYKRTGKGWKHVSKDKDKYQHPPWAPDGTTKSTIDGAEVYTLACGPL